MLGFDIWAGLRCGGGQMCQSYEERLPYVWEDGSPTGKVKSVEEAIRVLNLILHQDRLADGQRVDLNYVREVLKGVRDGEPVNREAQHVAAIMAADEIDCSTQAFLLAFSRKVERKRKLRDVVNAVRMGIRMKHKLRRRTTASSSSDKERSSSHGPGLVAGVLEGIDSWGDFDVFQLSSEAPGSVLQTVTRTVMDRRNIVRSFSFSRHTVQKFFGEVESRYLDNAYHNAIHAADVTQGVHVLLDRGMGTSLSELEIFAVVFAAACHDVGHMGLNNDFLVKSQHDIAMTYNDESVNENMHLATAYRILARQDCDFLRDSFTPKQRESMRKMVVAIVLATDMAHHFTNLNALNRMIEEKGKDFTKWDSTLQLLEAVLHCADLSNAAKPMRLALQWTDRVLEEFFVQGDQERRLGRDVSPLCDRYSVSKASSQTGFISFIVRPMFQALTPLCNTEDMLGNLQSCHQHWSQELCKEKRKRATRQTREVRSAPEADKA